MRPIKLWWLGAALTLLNGCASFRAVDSTKYAQAVTAGESQVTYTVVPGSIAGMPENAIAIPTVPGKDVTFRSYYADGTPQWELTTQRSAVLEMLAAGISGFDAEKFLADQQTREWASQERAAYMSLMQPFIQVALQRAQQPSAPDTTTSALDAARAWRELLRETGPATP